jgi:hypothetical protein
MHSLNKAPFEPPYPVPDFLSKCCASICQLMADSESRFGDSAAAVVLWWEGGSYPDEVPRQRQHIGEVPEQCT